MPEIGKVSKVGSKFEWEIENFCSCDDESFTSPYFYALDSTWYIRLIILKTRSDDISLYLARCKEETSVDCEYTLGIKSLNNSTNYEKEQSSTFGLEGDVCGWYQFIDWNELCFIYESELFSFENLIITCSLKIKNTTRHFDTSHAKLAADLKVLFTSKENSDVTLYIKGEKSLAHRIVLAARSPVFATMFRNDTEEKTTGIVNIVDTDSKAFNVFLLYLYTAEADFSKCNVCDLYRISDTYDVPELKLMSVHFMIENFSVRNFNEILILSHEFAEIDLLAHLQSFFNKNFKYIVSSTSWELLLKTNYRLANSLLKAMAEKIQIIE